MEKGAYKTGATATSVDVASAGIAKASRDAVLVFGIVFLVCLFGILTRPLGFLAAFWPANAVLIGIFVRYPRLASSWGWGAAAIGFIAADLVTGGGFLVTLWLTAANLAGVATAWILFKQLRDDDRHLRRPLSVLYLFSICLAAACVSALVGAGIAPVIYDRSFFEGLAFWFATEVVNSITVLPAILTAPAWLAKALIFARPKADGVSMGQYRLAPLGALAASIAVGVLIGGPGAIAFPVPALLWCALSYSLFSTAVLTMLVSTWKMVAVFIGFLPLPNLGEYMDSAVSLRLGITLLALGPLTVASINAARNDLMRKLDIAASYDQLTGALARPAFMGRGDAELVSLFTGHASVAALMLDIDHFKTVNDDHGHAAGDAALAAFGAAIQRALRSDDLFGRLGGEEFAVILPRVSFADAMLAAERLLAEVEALQILLPSGEALRITMSIGLAHGLVGPGASLSQMLTVADAALYRAKSEGRNRVSAVQE